MGLFDGPLSQFGGGNRNPAMAGARAGMAFGPGGMAIGALAGWLYGRYGTQTGQIQGQQTANAMMGNDISRTQDQIWGNSPAPAPQDAGYSMDPNATSMGPPAPNDENGDGRMNPAERRDAAEGGYANSGVSNFMVGGSPVIFGSGDPNGRYRNRGTDFGG
jgi:hypothetical protein